MLGKTPPATLPKGHVSCSTQERRPISALNASEPPLALGPTPGDKTTLVPRLGKVTQKLLPSTKISYVCSYILSCQPQGIKNFFLMVPWTTQVSKV